MTRPLHAPGDVRRLLSEAGLAPRKAYGQNFVVDPNTVRKVVRDAGVEVDEPVVEIGPGVGSLTLALLEAGARVLAVEVDAGMVRLLADLFYDEPRVEVVHADALRVDWVEEVRRFSPQRPPAMVANLPYNVATHLVMGALESQAFDRLHVMVQKEVGRRWAARPGDPDLGGVSTKMQALADVRVVARVPRTAFLPVPNVDSVTVSVRPRPWAHDLPRERVALLVDAGFAQRRKRLRNALASPSRPPAVVEGALTTAGLDPGARAEELDLDAWVRLAAALHG